MNKNNQHLDGVLPLREGHDTLHPLTMFLAGGWRCKVEASQLAIHVARHEPLLPTQTLLEHFSVENVNVARANACQS